MSPLKRGELFEISTVPFDQPSQSYGLAGKLNEALWVGFHFKIHAWFLLQICEIRAICPAGTPLGWFSGFLVLVIRALRETCHDEVPIFRDVGGFVVKNSPVQRRWSCPLFHDARECHCHTPPALAQMPLIREIFDTNFRQTGNPDARWHPDSSP